MKGLIMARFSIDESKNSLVSFNELLAASFNYYLRLKLEALPQTPQFQLTPQRLMQIFKEASANGNVARMRFYRVGVRLGYAMVNHDVAAFEMALQDLKELGKVGRR